MSRTKLAMLRIFAWFNVFGVPSLIWGSTDVSNLASPTGKVSLFSFERGYLRTITDNVNTEVVLNGAPRYFEAYLFECNATFPVQWAYIGEAAPVVTADVGRFFQDFYDVSTYTYQSILLMYSLQELQSGRYICRGASKEHDKLAIHYDVFVPGNGTQILLSTSEKKLFIPETKEHAYIPCGVSDSTAVVNLYRGNQWGTFYPVPVNGSITYNPRKGFKIRFKDFLDPWGTYLCVSESNKKRRKVHLIPESLKAKYDMINHVSGKIPVYFSYEYEYNRVLCCTGTNFIPKLQWAGCGSILDCQVKSACFEEDRCEQRLGNSGYNPTKWIDPGPLPPGCSGYRLRDDPNGDFGLFKCSTPGIAQYQPYLLNRGNIFLDFEKTPPSEMILTLQRISPEGPSFVGDEVEFHCNSTRFYFAYGIRWGWERVSGEIEFIDDANVVRDKYSIRGHRRRTTLKIPRPDIKSVICFVPVVNSATEWRTVSLPVVIASNDVNFISHQNPNPIPNNVIDLDSITYHTDYDDKANPAAVQPQQDAHPNPPQSQFQTQNPQRQQQQQQPPANLQVYNSAKTPYQEIQGVIPPASTEEQHRHQNNPNYYSYTHDNSHQSQHQGIPDTHILQEHSNDIHSHSSRVHPIAQPHTADTHSHVQASTPSPSIISISRSKKSRNRPSSGGNTPSVSRSDSTRTVPNLKPDAHYDTVDKEYSYDTFEPRPSSSSKSNSRLHNSRPHSSQHSSHQSHRIQTSSSRIPYQQQTSSSSHGSSRRPSSSTSSSSSDSRRQSYQQNDFSYSTPKKTYRNYNNYNEKTEFGVDMRLSLPFEPATPSRSRYAHGSNYTTIATSFPATSSRTSSSSSKSHSGDRSSSRRPISSHTHSSARPYHRQENDRHHQHHSRIQSEKDYSIDDSYSQHVRLTLPANSISTHIPKVEKGSGSRSRSHSPTHTTYTRGRGHSSSTAGRGSSSGSSNNRNVDYYYTDDSPVEIKVPHTKSHDSYRTSSRQDRRHHSHSSGHSNIKDALMSSEIIDPKPAHHEPSSSSPTAYLRRRPSYSRDDHHTYSQATTAQPYVYRQETQSHSDHLTSNNHHHQAYQPHHSYMTPEHQQPNYYQHHGSNLGHQEGHRSSGRHRSYSRGLKFDADTAAEGVALIDAYEFTSPTARPAYLVSTPQQTQNSNEFINADMELKRVQPHQRLRSTTTPAPTANKAKGNSSADILHSLSISISSRVTLDNAHNHNDGQSGAPVKTDHSIDHDTVHEKPHNEIEETEDYDIYSPQYTNYKVTTVLPPTPKPVVPIQFFVKPTDVSSFQPAKSIIDEEDEYDLG